MEIYADVLLLTNYIINIFLLSCHAKFTGRRMKNHRKALAALAGAAGALTIFLPFMGFFGEILCRFLISALIVRIAAPSRGLKAFLRDLAVFFIVSFLFAGIMLALWMFLRPAGMLYSNGIVYFDISPVTLLLSMAAAYLLTGIFWRFTRAGRIPAESYRITIRKGNNTAVLDAFVDSANSLYEPFDNSPVIVCRLDRLHPLFTPEQYLALLQGDFEKASGLGMKLRFVPYKVVQGGGILPAFRADEITLEDLNNRERRFTVEDAYIAATTGDIAHGALLHPGLTKHGTPAGV